MRIKTRVQSTRKARALLVGPAILAVAAISCVPAPEEREGGEQDAVETAPETTVAQPADVEAAVDDFVAAWEQENLEAATGALTADAVAYDPAPPGKFEGAEGIHAWISGAFEELDQIDITLTERSVRTVGRVAWFQARYVFAAQPVQPEAEPIRDEGYVSMIWVRQEDGSYKSPLFHASEIPEEMPEEEGA